MRAGHKLIIIEFDGGDSIKLLKNESGGHRIQRIPESEHKGRVHSSTVTVAVIEGFISETVYDKRSEKDFLIEWYSGTGCGGQHRNRHPNSARITHIPTGIVKQAQTRSRQNSFKEAMEALIAELDKQKLDASGLAENGSRRQQVGSGERSDKRRTYRFRDNQVTDHITGKSAQVNKVMKGDFRLLW